MIKKMTMSTPVITIDGPSGAGKSTLSKALAEKLQWHFLESGAIYRALALSTIKHHLSINIDNEEALLSLVFHMNVKLKIKKGKLNVILENKDISKTIQNENIGHIASKIAIFPRIRKALLMHQRKFRTTPGLIADGRDMGTVVFPDATVKFFLNASLEERTYRRMHQLQKNGFNVNFKSLLKEIKKRDNRDYNRTISPLISAVDAVILDSTRLTIEKMTMKALAYIEKFLA